MFKPTARRLHSRPGPRRGHSMRRARAWLRTGLLGGALGVATLGSVGCPTYTAIPDDVRLKLEERHEGQIFWLQQSLYVGQFYDDDRYRLVQARAFDQETYLRTAEGDPIYPPPADGIIPAGTRVRLVRIAWPTGDAVFARPLYTPRYATWLTLRVAMDRGDTLLERDAPHILLMPSGVKNADVFNLLLGTALSREDPTPWLNSLAAPIRRGVLEKRPVIGMDEKALFAAMGLPDRIHRRQVPGPRGLTTAAEAQYGPLVVRLKGGLVTGVFAGADMIDAETSSAQMSGVGAQPTPARAPAPAPHAAPTASSPEPAPSVAAPTTEAGAPTESQAPLPAETPATDATPAVTPDDAPAAQEAPAADAAHAEPASPTPDAL